ncbi:MAG: hypothetical protein SFY81_11675 [Verrucomicrobiota bacterium]|nr:hypothetical protein [Verrucomicrobiota bacterium]
MAVRAEVDPKYYAVMVSASVQSSPARVTLTWASDERATGYTVSRKGKNATSWSQIATLPGSATTYTDSNVADRNTYEYALSKTTSWNYPGTGYAYVGINAPLIENRGKVVLLVENLYANDLAMELTRLEQDLAGDGWTVLRHDVSRTASVPSIKEIIKADYNADPANVKAVFLFGRVPVPYSGNFNPDGHEDHNGAWPADLYYGDMDGNWTDSSVNNSGSHRPANRNVPGDGKFDQSNLPGNVELAVGRVDLSNMTCYANKSPARSEKDLLRQYLNKDHNFRHRLIDLPRRGLVCDNFGEREGEAFAASGWRNFAPMFGADNVASVGGGQFFTTLNSQGYLWSYGTGGGSYYTCNGVGGSDDFALGDIKSVFTMFLGSYFGDWDNESNFLRAPLGSTTYTLTTSWAGRPHWFYHHMALGETIGYSTLLSQNNGYGGLYAAQNWGTRQVHAALMGDPTLRMHMVTPPANLNGTITGGSVNLTWGASPDSDIQGYVVYKGTSSRGPFTRISGSSLLGGTFFNYTGHASGTIYMVRAVKLERSGSGSYLNPSQGIFYPNNVQLPPQGPVAPSALVAISKSISQIDLRWSDNANNESGFVLDRRVGNGEFFERARLSANSITFTDSGLSAGTQYSYRVRAYNSNGESGFSSEATARTSLANSVTPVVSLVTTDMTTRGSWKGVYGSDGYQISGDGIRTPGYVSLSQTGSESWLWSDSTSELRALERTTSGRLASAWYGQSFTVDLNLLDGETHRVAMYFLDWDATSSNSRVQTVEVLDASSGAVLDTQTVANFSTGKWLVWNLKGSLKFRFTKVSGYNAIVNGIFFDPATSNPATGSSSGQILAGKFNLKITGQPGQRFKIYESSNLNSWAEKDVITLSSNTYLWIDPLSSSSAPLKFYRAVPQP